LRSRALANIVASVVRRVAHAVSVSRNRKALAALARLDEHMLADMGLTRADIRDAVAQPLWSDPTAVLAERRRERQDYDYRAVFTDLIQEHKAIPLAPAAPDCTSRRPPARLQL
jgi:uncharacterized protein YjiS (DUF1127 family)